MLRKLNRKVGVVLLAMVAIISLILVQTASAHGGPGRGFVRRMGPELWLDGRPFRFAGTNNYYLMYKSQAMVDDVLDTAAGNNFKVMRTWGFLDIGNEDDTNSIRGKQEGVYFQYWDGAAPAYNDGPDGLERLDYVIYKAGQVGIKLVIPVTNNWADFGGMDQYVRWNEGQYHDDFYTSPVIREWYKSWISHLLNRTNIYSGIQYKDDPTIMTWELGNEPRCKGSGVYPMSDACTTQTLIDWADDVSRYIKTIDRNHLVSVGDEGFYCNDPASTDWTENCGEGVDTLAFTKLRNIDVMSYHLYPDGWGKDAAWGTQWIKQHSRDARRLFKPSMLGEFGFKDKATRNPVYKEWTDTVLMSRGNGALYWILSGIQDNGTLYPDYDGFTVYCPSPVCTTINNCGQMISSGFPKYFPPVADNDAVPTEFNTPVTVAVAANDVAYGFKNVVMPATIDLDPATDGKQTTIVVTGGSFALQADGTVLFAPDDGFAGKVQISYTIKDVFRKVSNVANVEVTVKPDPTAAILLFSFEDGTQGWAPADFNETAGTVAQSDAYATEGSFSLQVGSIDGGWFGVAFPEPLDLSSKLLVKIDVDITDAGGSWTNVAFHTGDDWDWCQAPGEWLGQDTIKTIEVELAGLACNSGNPPNLSLIQDILVYFNGGAYMDNVKAE